MNDMHWSGNIYTLLKMFDKPVSEEKMSEIKTEWEQKKRSGKSKKKKIR